MSRKQLGLNYKESQILKHSLQISTENKLHCFENTPELLKDIEEEKRLLKRVEEFANEYKKYIGKQEG